MQRDQGWGLPLEVVGVRPGQRCTAWFSGFYKLEDIPQVLPEISVYHEIERVFSGESASVGCFLAKEWNFEAIRTDARKRKGHQYSSRKYDGLPALVATAVYDFEAALQRFPYVSAVSVADFYTSWQFWNYVREFCNEAASSVVARHLPGGPLLYGPNGARIAFALESQFCAYAHEIAPPLPSIPVISQPPSKQAEFNESTQANAKPDPAPSPTMGGIATQLKALMAEDHIEIKELAGKIGLDFSTVWRHTAGQKARQKQISLYESYFSKRLKRNVVIKPYASVMQMKRK
jgi:hypothetical protein